MGDPNTQQAAIPLIQDPPPAEEARRQLSEQRRRMDEDAEQEALYDTY
jgi:hypothetical protein